MSYLQDVILTLTSTYYMYTSFLRHLYIYTIILSLQQSSFTLSRDGNKNSHVGQPSNMRPYFRNLSHVTLP